MEPGSQWAGGRATGITEAKDTLLEGASRSFCHWTSESQDTSSNPSSANE